MQLTMRAYQSEEDYWRIREFLREVFLLNGRREHGWHVAWIDYWRWCMVENGYAGGSLEETVLLWETAGGQLAAVLHPEEAGHAYLQVHPAFRSAELEKEMIVRAEERLAIQSGAKQALNVWARSDDARRADVLARLGYARGQWAVHVWRRDLNTLIPEAPPAKGYAVRSLGDMAELPARSWAAWRAFHPDAPDDQYKGWQWYLNVQRCPLYRRDLDIVVVAPAGEIASFCTFWYDDVTRTAYIEPVGTAPEHRLRGLARAAITEGLRRVQWMGAVRVFVSGLEPAPNALYAASLSNEYDLFEQWVKEW